jgi:arginyl-tRNA synthetase
MNNEDILKADLVKAAAKVGVDVSLSDVTIDHSKDPAHGDFASNLALKFAKKLGKKPLDFANEIKSAFVSEAVDHVEIAGPGFLNFFMKGEALGSIVATILAEGKAYGQAPKKQRSVDVEYVSANPTGDLHLGHTRGAALGDAIANLYAKAGYDVTREYYVNNCGNQVEHLGHSLGLRYHELFGEKITLGDDDYHGEDIIADCPRPSKRSLAINIFKTTRNPTIFSFPTASKPKWRRSRKIWRTSASILTNSPMSPTSAKARRSPIRSKSCDQKGFVYDLEGATYLKTTAILDKDGKPLDDKDRPIVKSNGMYTYFMPDICYHYNKMSRGFSLLVDMLGADHFGYLNRMRAALAMKGYSYDSLAFGIYQIVKVYKDGEEVKMSKRTGKAIAHRDLVADVGVDAVRYFFSEKSGDTPILFDMNLALSKSKDNPVYYAQYAHARCHSLLEMGKEFPLVSSLKSLTSHEEGDILKQLADFPSMIEAAAEARAPYKVAGYIHALSQSIHGYYASTKIIDHEDKEGTGCRLALMKAAMITLENALAILGVSAPDAM